MVLAFSFSFEFGGRDAFIDELYVEPEYRRRGLGARALQFVEEACLTLGVSAVHLEVTRKNDAALKLYRNAGFRDHDRYLMTKWIPKRGNN